MTFRYLSHPRYQRQQKHKMIRLYTVSLLSQLTVNSMNFRAKLLFITVLTLLFSPSLILANPAKQSTGGRITQSASLPSSFEDYRQECLQRAKKEGLTPDVSKDLCNCTIKKFQSQYTFSQFRALVQKSKSDRTASRTLTSVGEACFDQILYEE